MKGQLGATVVPLGTFGFRRPRDRQERRRETARTEPRAAASVFASPSPVTHSFCDARGAQGEGPALPPSTDQERPPNALCPSRVTVLPWALAGVSSAPQRGGGGVNCSQNLMEAGIE